MLKGPYKSIPANPLIATPMYLAGYIEKVGTGTRDIYRFCKEAGLKEPEFHFDGDFRITIWRKDKSEPINEPINEPIDRLLAEIRQTPELTKEMLAEKLKMSRSTVTRLLTKLKKDNIIERIGSNKKGYWQIKNIIRKQ